MRRNTLTTAVLAGLTGIAGMTGVANAVHVNPDGLGQVLLYPYYTTRGGNDTLISIVNTTDRGKAVKIRFIEALNSREVLDFNIYMSPFDVWTAAITGGEDAPGIRTTDTTCTVPYFVGDSEDGVGEQPFLPFAYTGPAADGGPSGIERAASGYIEVIEMGAFVEQPTLAPAVDNPQIVAWWAKHVDGEPRNCDAIVDLWRRPGGGVSAPGELGWWNQEGGDDPEFGFVGNRGGLFGSASIVNPDKGYLFSYDATAIANFYQSFTVSHTDPGFLTPSLQDGDVGFHQALISGVTSFSSNAFLNWDQDVAGHLPLNGALTINALLNEYSLESSIEAATEWVVTFPTKRFHTDAVEFGLEAAIPPFGDLWTKDDPYSCDTIPFEFWDREEAKVEPDDGGVVVSPRPPGVEPDEFQLCREANVIRFTNKGDVPDRTEILGEPSRSIEELSYVNFEVPGSFESGWTRFNFDRRDDDGEPLFVSVNSQISERTEDGITRPIGGERVVGLPAIGFGVTTAFRGDMDGVIANYGGTFKHRGTREFPIQSATD